MNTTLTTMQRVMKSSVKGSNTMMESTYGGGVLQNYNLASQPYLCGSYPEPAAVPDTHHVGRPLDAVKHDVLHLGSLVVVILQNTLSTAATAGQ